eukprot:2785457-Pyramimonas_sp.AAC.1
MDTWYVELQEETELLETASWEPVCSVPTDMVISNHALAAVASEEQGRLREIAYAPSHHADEIVLAPWNIQYDEICNFDSDDHG